MPDSRGQGPNILIRIAGVIGRLLQVILLAVVAYGAWWVCERFGVPASVYWVCGVIVVVIVILVMATRGRTPP